MKIFVHISCVMALCALGSGYTIISNQQRIETESGTDHRLECTVEGSDFNAIYHTLNWVKMQLETDTTGESVATFANMQGEFTGQPNKYKVEIESQTSPVERQSFTLVVNDVTHEDSGWYRCQITEGGSVTQSVKHRLFVYAPVMSVVMFGSPLASDVPHMPSETPAELAYQENQNGYLECRAVGGFPKPTLRLLLDNVQFTGDSNVKDLSPDVPELQGDTVGLQSIVYTRRAVIDTYRPEAVNDGKTLTCRVQVMLNGQVQGMLETTTKLNIQGAPVFGNCSREVKAPVGHQNVMLWCEFTSKPEWDMVEWQGISTGVNVTGASTSSSNNPDRIFTAYTQAMPGNSRYKAILVISQTQPTHFQAYKLTVRNSIDKSETTLRLSEGASTGDGRETKDNASPQSAAPLSLLLVLLIALLPSGVH